MTALRIILRGLTRTPVFTLVAIVSLALGIGANTAIFSLLDQVLLRTLPVQHPEELAYLYHPGPTQGSVSTDEDDDPSFSYPMFREMQRDQTPFTGLAGARNASASISYKNQPASGSARLVSGNYFEVLGVRPAIGRLFTDDDDRTPGGHPVVVLSHGYWTERFGADPAVLNQSILINGNPMTIVGVAQKRFTSERAGGAPDIFVPVTMKKELSPGWDAFRDRNTYWITLLGRRKPGVSMEQAAAAINVTYRAQLEQDIQLLRQPRADFLQRFKAKKIILKPGEHGRGGMLDVARQPLFLIMSITVLVLLLCCANVANLQLARSAARTREIAVRLALGASRGQLVRQLLAESCLLAISGGLLGLAVAQWSIRGILAAMPPGAGANGYLSPDLDARVLAYSLALSVATGILFGLFPALRSTRPDLVPALKEQSGQATSDGASNAFRKTLVTAQVAVSLLLLISAGLFGRSVVNLGKVELGIQTDHLLTFLLAPKLNQYTDERSAQLYRQLNEKLAALPGVRLASAARVPAIAGNNEGTNITVEGYVPPGDESAMSSLNLVGADYFRTMGMPLIAGREFSAADSAGAPKVAVVNEAFVRHFIPQGNALGRRMARGGGNVKLDVEIVGVVKDAKYSSMRKAPPRVFYVPYQQYTRQDSLFFYVRTALPPEQLATAVRRGIAALDPNLPIREFKTMEAQIEENMFHERMLSTLTACFATLATLLAAMGLYGVLAYNVARRTREIGIRVALGAHARHVRGLVMKEVAMMLAIGVPIGLALAAAAGSAVQTQLYGLKPWDPLVYISSAVLLALVALAAAYAPTRRATKVDPMVALRYE